LSDAPGPDLLGLLVGSEGTLALVTSVTVRILRRPETVQTLLAAFDTIDAGGAVVSDIIGAGIIPAAVEMMDSLAIRAAEAAVHPNFPDADTVLIVELDGPAPEVAAEILSYCIEAGGSLTGEHGIGADKSQYMPTMFTPDDLALMQRLRAVFDPAGICNPGKVFPTPRLCGEVPGPYRRHPAEAAGL